MQYTNELVVNFSIAGVIIIANAKILAESGDTDSALSTLRGVSPESVIYEDAVQAMSDIYLNDKKDKKMYISCLQEMNNRSPSTHSALNLGDAYMTILEPSKAIEVWH